MEHSLQQLAFRDLNPTNRGLEVPEIFGDGLIIEHRDGEKIGNDIEVKANQNQKVIESKGGKDRRVSVKDIKGAKVTHTKDIRDKKVTEAKQNKSIKHKILLGWISGKLDQRIYVSMQSQYCNKQEVLGTSDQSWQAYRNTYLRHCKQEQIDMVRAVMEAESKRYVNSC